MSSAADGNTFEDVFVFDDLVYAMEHQLRVVHVYGNRNNLLIKLGDIRYSCDCGNSFSHSIIVTDEHIVQCCTVGKLVSILDSSGELLRRIPIADISGHWPILCQVDVDGSFFIASSWTIRLAIAHANQPRSRWGIVYLTDLPDHSGCEGAVWFRHRLYLVSSGRLLTLTPTN